jgi:hypothetical protein
MPLSTRRSPPHALRRSGLFGSNGAAPKKGSAKSNTSSRRKVHLGIAKRHERGRWRNNRKRAPRQKTPHLAAEARRSGGRYVWRQCGG